MLDHDARPRLLPSTRPALSRFHPRNLHVLPNPEVATLRLRMSGVGSVTGGRGYSVLTSTKNFDSRMHREFCTFQACRDQIQFESTASSTTTLHHVPK